MRIYKIFTILILAALFTSVAHANHAWGKYHWDKSTADTETNPLQLGNNLSAGWNSSLASADTNWALSVIKTTVAGGNSDANCSPTSGRVEVCNGEYGNNGWLGIASIWATRGKSNHITQGTVKVNDTYFNTAKYNTQDWRTYVMCQEVGHILGLGHQDEDFNNADLETCMDYTNNPASALHPNPHDYEMLTEMYAHLNSTGGGSGGGGNGNGNNGKKPKKVDVAPIIDLNDPSEWGKAVAQDSLGRNSTFERVLPNNQVLITHVFWAQ